MDLGALEHDLRRAIAGEVRFDRGSQALYATDASNYRQVPLGVVVPRSSDDVVKTVLLCSRHGVPMLSRGAGTSLAGQTCNAAVVIDLSKYVHAIRQIDPDRRLARVEPGLVLDTLQRALAPHGLLFGPDPATHSRCTIGGMLGNNACGTHSLMAGKTVDNVESLEVLTADGLRLTVGATSEAELAAIIAGGGRRGQLYAGLRDLRDRYANQIRAGFPRLPRRVSGFNLEQLLPEHGCNVARALVGSEATCATVLEATLRLLPRPPHRALLVVGFADVAVAGDHAATLRGLGPIGLEGVDDRLASLMRRAGPRGLAGQELPLGDGWLLAEWGGDTAAQALAQARAAQLELGSMGVRASCLYAEPAAQAALWAIRESGLGAARPGTDEVWPGWEDAAVPPERLGEYLRDFRRLLASHGYQGSIYGHFGDGCIHVRLSFDLRSTAGIARFRRFLDEAADLVVSYGGSLSGEHGDGQARGALLEKMYGRELVAAMREFKQLWDPQNLMNPGKVVAARDPAADLRVAPRGPVWQPATFFAYPQDRGGLAGAAERCIGIGACRRPSGGLMCPSYQATGDEEHSTRGRARLLWEMLRGETVGAAGWRDPHVRAALDLCLSCKGCKSDCPTGVDMATYKAEFMAQHYAGRLRPRAAYVFGLLPWSLGLAGRAPRLVNAMVHGRLSSRLLKGLAGIAPARQLPRLATRPWRPPLVAAAHSGQPVVLWPDTWTVHVAPEVGHAASALLHAAGYAVTGPALQICCGRPLYDHGWLGLARRQLRRIVAALRPAIAAGTPIVVLEPSCASVLRDELPNLLADEPAAAQLAGLVVSLAELLLRTDLPLSPLAGRPIVWQPHCHQRAVLGLAAEQQLLERLGASLELPEPGCCGMAGAFGLERGAKHAISQRLAERALLPAVRAADPAALIVADGFSCREQIRGGTGRRVWHTAQVAALALAAQQDHA